MAKKINKIQEIIRTTVEDLEEDYISDDEEEKKVVSRDDQNRHIEVMLNILKKFNFVLDSSALSSGKTYTAMSIYQKLNLKNIIYIGALSMIEKIREVFKRYNIPTEHLYTFQGLRSTKGKQPKHKLLTRTDDEDGNVIFKPTKKLKKIVEEGVLLVADEIQYVRNDDSLQCSALTEIERIIIKSNNGSGVMELSGLPGGREKYYMNMLRRFRIIKNDKLYSRSKETGGIELLGAKELQDFCMKHNPEKTKKVIDSKPFREKNVLEVCFDLYTEIVQDLITDSMPPPDTDAKIDCKNGYYNLSREDSCHLVKSITNLDRASGYNSNTGIINNSKNICWSMVTKSLRHIEISKINLFIANAKRDLEANPNAKVCIGLNYSITIELIAEALKEYGSLILRGNVPGNKRKPIMDKFNEPNNKYRVLVGNIKIINCGVEFDDRDGNYPRYVYGSASYFFIECHQFPGRFVRGKETKSNVKFRFVFGLISKLEKSILKALASHTDVCLRTLKKQVEKGVVFPGEYEDDIFNNEECEMYYDVGEILKSLNDNKDKLEMAELPANFLAKKRKEKRNIIRVEEFISDNDEDEEVTRPKRPPPTILDFKGLSKRDRNNF